MNFQEAEELYTTTRKRKLDNNTYLVQLNEDTYGIQLHATVVVKIHRDGTYTIDNGGYDTRTTKERINQYSPARITGTCSSIRRSQGEWFIDDGVPFVRGCRVDSNGKLVTRTKSK